MRKALRWRYYCEFCKKAGNSAFAMKTHEAGCTMNPNRKCRMCDFVAGTQKPIRDLMALLPDPKAFEKKMTDCDFTFFDGLDGAVTKALPALRDSTDNCPACIMAALRQKGIPVPCANGFNFTQECKELWAEVNENHYEPPTI